MLPFLTLQLTEVCGYKINVGPGGIRMEAVCVHQPPQSKERRQIKTRTSQKYGSHCAAMTDPRQTLYSQKHELEISTYR